MAGGGHAMAAGPDRAGRQDRRFQDFLADRLMEESALAAEQDVVEVDALVTPKAADRALHEDFQRLIPFGPGNPEPLFALADVVAEQPRLLRGGHVRCTVTGAGGKLKAVAWRAEDTDLGRRLMSGGGGLHLVGKLKADDWNGRQGVELEIEDAADPRRLS